MDLKLKIVTRMPLEQLWRNDGVLVNSRGQMLTAEEIVLLLRLGPLVFVVADVGFPLTWIESEHCYEFWNKEVKPHLASGPNFVLKDYPGEYCYVASKWSSAQEPMLIVLLEKQH